MIRLDFDDVASPTRSRATRLVAKVDRCVLSPLRTPPWSLVVPRSRRLASCFAAHAVDRVSAEPLRAPLRLR